MNGKHKPLAGRMGWALALGATLALAGCGGGGSDDMGQGGGSASAGSDPLAGVPASASQSAQGLMAYLQALVKTAPDDREPAALDGSPPPRDDAGEPAPLG